MRIQPACIFVSFLHLFLSACAIPPDAGELRRHLAATVQAGWSGLRIANVKILDCVEAGTDWKVDALYTVRLIAGKNTLPQDEQARIARSLPMCDAVLIRKGDHCAMRESVTFTRTAYGWMPRDLVAARPDLLPRIAEEGEAPPRGP